MKKILVLGLVIMILTPASVMAYEFCTSLPDNNLTKIRNAMAWSLGYKETIFDRDTRTWISNPESRITFLHRKRVEEIKKAVAGYNLYLERQGTTDAAETQTDLDTVGIVGN